MRFGEDITARISAGRAPSPEELECLFQPTFSLFRFGETTNMGHELDRQLWQGVFDRLEIKRRPSCPCKDTCLATSWDIVEVPLELRQYHGRRRIPGTFSSRLGIR